MSVHVNIAAEEYISQACVKYNFLTFHQNIFIKCLKEALR